MTTAKLHMGDCVDVLKTLPAEHADFIMFSPPYDDLKAYDGYKFDRQTMLALGAQCLRVAKEGAPCVIVMNDSVKNGNRSCTSLQSVLDWKALGWYCHDLVPWLKQSTPYTTVGRMASAWELIACMSKTKPSFIKIPTKPNRRAGAVLKRKDGTSYTVKAEGVVPNYLMLDVGKNKTQSGGLKFPHEAPYPPSLCQRFIQMWCPPNGLVLDPMMGIASTGVGTALAGEGRAFEGVDCSKRYVSWSSRRLRATKYFSEVRTMKQSLDAAPIDHT